MKIEYILRALKKSTDISGEGQVNKVFLGRTFEDGQEDEIHWAEQTIRIIDRGPNEIVAGRRYKITIKEEPLLDFSSELLNKTKVVNIMEKVDAESKKLCKKLVKSRR